MRTEQRISDEIGWLKSLDPDRDEGVLKSYEAGYIQALEWVLERHLEVPQ